MWIFLSVLAFIVFLLLLPISIIIKNDDNNNNIFLIKFLFFKFDFKGDSSEKNKKQKKTDREARKQKEKTAEKKDFRETVSEIMKLISNIFEELLKLFKHLVARKFQLQIICASKDAAQAAIHYGECCAAVYPVLGFISSAIKVKEKGRDIDIRCEYDKSRWTVKYHFIISIRICHILAALIRFGAKEIKRRIKNATAQTKKTEQKS